VPATVGLMVLARPIVAMIFEHGKFTASDTLNTAAALQFYAIGLVGYSIVRIISPTFYALGRSRVPVMVSAGSVLANVVLNITLVKSFGYRGLALGTSVTAILNASVQLFLLRREIHGIEGSRIAGSFARVVAAAAVMGVVTAGVNWQLLSLMPGSGLTTQMMRLLTTITIALITLVAMAQMLRIPEYAEARDLVIGRFKRMAR
jgi:putative peptidoglycan lipid II flippase